MTRLRPLAAPTALVFVLVTACIVLTAAPVDLPPPAPSLDGTLVDQVDRRAGEVARPDTPTPPGRLVDVGSHRLHLWCVGEGHPTVVIEGGLGGFSFDWMLVQQRLATAMRVCAYDRAGYAWSDRGPFPRTFDQLNLELKTALATAGEQGPFVLVGHSFGGPVVRRFALIYPDLVAGLVFVDAAHERGRFIMAGRAILLGADATGRPVPPARLDPAAIPKTPLVPDSTFPPLDSLFEVLPAAARDWHRWAQSLPGLSEAEDGQREWSGDYYATWRRRSQAGSLGAIPLLVIARARGEFPSNLDIPADRLEAERIAGQESLAGLSSRSRIVWLPTDHNMHLSAPEALAELIRPFALRSGAGPTADR